MNYLLALAAIAFLLPLPYYFIYGPTAVAPLTPYKIDLLHSPYAPLFGFYAVLLGVFFSFLLSTFFYGFGAILAMLLEGMKFGYFIFSKGVSYVDFFFILPQLLAVAAGLALASAVAGELADKTRVRQNWFVPASYLTCATSLALLYFILRTWIA
ncbi:hypothetical protein HY993_03725 [Candidatus Micrarchaeota archaeon]|nr:hypothetical protein [Candidatus Micrarchaeota archaeon]